MQIIEPTIVKKPWGTETILFEDHFDLYSSIKCIKVLDTVEPLSIQVHPDKNELWYIAESEPDSVIYSGLKFGVTIKDIVWTSDPSELLTKINPVPGDRIYVPCGYLHSLGSYIKAYEVSDDVGTTYRLYDWDRTGRELHIDEARLTIDMTNTSPDLRHFKIEPMEIVDDITIEMDEKTEVFFIPIKGKLTFIGVDRDGLYQVSRPSVDHVLTVPNNTRKVKCVGNGKMLVIKGEK